MADWQRRDAVPFMSEEKQGNLDAVRHGAFAADVVMDALCGRARERLECRRPIRHDEVCELEALGRRVAILRRAAGLTQRQVAGSAELTAGTIRRIEAGTRRTRRSTLERLAVPLAVDPVALIELAGRALAPESRYAARVGRRRARRMRARKPG